MMRRFLCRLGIFHGWQWDELSRVIWIECRFCGVKEYHFPLDEHPAMWCHRKGR